VPGLRGADSPGPYVACARDRADLAKGLAIERASGSGERFAKKLSLPGGCRSSAASSIPVAVISNGLRNGVGVQDSVSTRSSDLVVSI
jgi:hypothetical protein